MKISPRTRLALAEELIGVVTHKKNIYVDLRLFGGAVAELFQRAIARLQDKASSAPIFLCRSGKPRQF
jgi:hypothetical protein